MAIIKTARTTKQNTKQQAEVWLASWTEAINIKKYADMKQSTMVPLLVAEPRVDDGSNPA